jgi:CheY-like chemotaxis protein
MQALLEAPHGTITAVPRYPVTPSNRILLVDDDLPIRQLMSQALVRSGYLVDTTEDGEEAWQAFHANSYDLLVTDNKMPGMSGLELVKKLRSAHIKLPIILVSGSLNREKLNQNRSLNIAATLSKPFTSDQLLQTVKEVLRVAVDVRTSSDTCVALWIKACSHVRPSSHWGINE